MPERNTSLLMVIDFQGKLARIVKNSETVIETASRLIQSLSSIDVSMMVTEQLPDKLGPTIPELDAHLPKERYSKSTFSCLGESRIASAVDERKYKDIIVCGIESHICVYQTVHDLLQRGHSVHVVADAVSSRTSQNRDIALSRMAQEGATITSFEMILFELLKDATDPAFREVLAWVR